MRRGRHRVSTVLGAAVLGGCALLASAPEAPPFPGRPGLRVQDAAQRITLGQSTRTQVAAALGTAETVRFESGWEVWVYRMRGTRTPNAAPELVVLFGPDGVARKIRTSG